MSTQSKGYKEIREDGVIIRVYAAPDLSGLKKKNIKKTMQKIANEIANEIKGKNHV